jgi:hypothetical protein
MDLPVAMRSEMLMRAINIISRVSILIVLCATWIQAQVHDNQTPDIQQLKDKLQQLEQEMQQLKSSN